VIDFGDDQVIEHFDTSTAECRCWSITGQRLSADWSWEASK